MRRIDLFLGRHRRAAALAGVTLVLGVAALNVHEALPEHHELHGDATMCVAALSIAVLAAVGLRPKSEASRTPGTRLAPIVLSRGRPHPRTCSAPARAGPLRQAVLRL
ncbi:MAG: hypothetical protein JWL67_2145 [Solirubrobacterales bacterium]|jgi:hypothetical protein|nr:hypothetical protein [Solirubrobacterales bacterium]